MPQATTANDVHELPQEIIDLIPKSDTESLSQATLQSLADVLIKSRDEAIRFRKESGIEEVWELCDEQYIGIDDANRNEFKDGKWIKPTVSNAPVTTASNKGGDSKRSTAFVRLTSRYVDAADSKVGEILLPSDGKAFSFSSTPNPTLLEGKKDDTQVVDPRMGPLFRKPRPEEIQPQTVAPTAQQVQFGQTPPPTPVPEKVPLTTKDLALEAIELTEEKAKRAEKRIHDWLIECQYSREMRKVIHDAARTGVGVLKGPYPAYKRQAAYINGKLKINEEIVPVVGWRDPWNIFPDPACGENIQDGDYLWERDYASVKQVRKMKKLPGYVERQLDEVIKEGPQKHLPEGRNPNDTDNDKKSHQFEVWYYTGAITKTQLAAVNPKAAEALKSGVEDAFAVVTIINNRVVHATLNPLEESGDLPYMNIPWQRRSGYWAGIGVGEQIRVPQRIVNAATRAMLNNAGVSSGAQIIIDQNSVKPADGDWAITPNKIWYKSADGTMDDVRKAFSTFGIESRVDEMLKIIDYGMRIAEESTNMPLITQGQSGKTTPETYGATQIQDNNANQLLRRIGYAFDDHITEPLIRMYYEWLLLDEDVPDEEKGDWKIDARGSSAMVERSIREQTLAQMTSIAENPIFGVDPKKWFRELSRSKKLNPKDLQYTKEELERMESAPKAPPIAVQVAQVKAGVEQMKLQVEQQRIQAESLLEKELAGLQGQIKLAAEKMRKETALLKIRMDTDRDTIYVRAQTEKIRADYDGKLKEIAAKKELMAMELAADQQITIEEAKVKLADTAMKLKVQKELAAADLSVSVHQENQKNRMSKKDVLPSPVEPAGRAKKGKAFTQ